MMTCATCRYHLGGGQCAQNLEKECAAGEYEAWEEQDEQDEQADT